MEQNLANITLLVSRLCSLYTAIASNTQGACCLVEFAGQTFSEAGLLAAALKKQIQPSSAPQLYAFDHIYSSDPETSLRIWQANRASAVVLYGTAGTACFQEMHQLLKEAVAKQYAEGMTLMPCHYTRGLSC